MTSKQVEEAIASLLYSTMNDILMQGWPYDNSNPDDESKLAEALEREVEKLHQRWIRAQR